MQKQQGQDDWLVPDDDESELKMREWRPLPTHEEYKEQAMGWVFAKDGNPRLKFKWPSEISKECRSEIQKMTDAQFKELKAKKDFRSDIKYLTAAKYRSAASKIRVEREYRSNIRQMTGERLDHELERMVKERRPTLKETDQFKKLMEGIRDTRSDEEKASPTSLTPKEHIENIVWFIRFAGRGGIRVNQIEKRFCHRKSRRAKTTIYRWLSELEEIGYLERKEFVIPSKRNPDKEKMSVYYRTTEEVKFPPAMFADMIEWHLGDARLEDQIAHMPREINDPGIDVPELAIMACRRLYIAKDLLLHKAGILDPDKAIDELYRGYYGMKSPNSPGVI